MNEAKQKELFTYLYEEYIKRPDNLIDISTFFKDNIFSANDWVQQCSEKGLIKAYAFILGKPHVTVSIQGIRTYIPEYTRVHILQLLKGLVSEYGVRGARALLCLTDNHISQTIDLVDYAESLGYITVIVKTHEEVFIKLSPLGREIYEKYKDA